MIRDIRAPVSASLFPKDRLYCGKTRFGEALSADADGRYCFFAAYSAVSFAVYEELSTPQILQRMRKRLGQEHFAPVLFHIILSYFLSHAGYVHIFIEGAETVYYSVVCYLDYTVCDRLGELMVVA